MPVKQIQLVGNPFAVGASVFDSTPYTNYFLRQEAEAKARNEALNKYFQDLDATISPTGMDVENDFPALEVMKDNCRKHYLQNKELINTKRDGGRAYVENMRMFGDMKSYIEQSKQKVGQIKEYEKFRIANPESIIDDEFIQNIDRARQPIRKVVADGLGNRHVMDNHDWKQIDFTEFQPVKPLTLEQLQKEAKSYSQGLKPGIDIKSFKKSERDPNKDIITRITALTPKQLAIVGSVAGSRYDSNKALRVTVKSYNPSEEEFLMLNNAFEGVMGRSISPESRRDLYIAKSIFDNMGETVDEREEINLGRQEATRAANERRVASIKAAGANQEPASQGNEFDGIKDFDEGGLVSSGGFITRKSNGTPFTGTLNVPVNKIPPTINSAIISLDKDDQLQVLDGRAELEVVDGVVVAAKTKKGFRFKRDNQALAQRRIDPSRKDEGPAPLGGNTAAPNKPKQTAPKKDPLGIL